MQMLEFTNILFIYSTDRDSMLRIIVVQCDRHQSNIHAGMGFCVCAVFHFSFHFYYIFLSIAV